MPFRGFPDVFIVPPGAGPGDARVVLNGPAGRIEIYDSNGQLVGVADASHGWQFNEPGDENGKFVRIWTQPLSDPQINFSTDDVDELLGALLVNQIQGAGGTRRYSIFVGSGLFNGATGSSTGIEVLSNSEDDTVSGQTILWARGGLTINPDEPNSPRFALYRRTGTLDAGGNFTLVGTPVTSANVLMIQARYLDGANQSLAFGGGIGPVVQSTGTIFDISGTGGANRPYEVTAIYTPA